MGDSECVPVHVRVVGFFMKDCLDFLEYVLVALRLSCSYRLCHGFTLHGPRVTTVSVLPVAAGRNTTVMGCHGIVGPIVSQAYGSCKRRQRAR